MHGHSPMKKPALKRALQTPRSDRTGLSPGPSGRVHPKFLVSQHARNDKSITRPGIQAKACTQVHTFQHNFLGDGCQIAIHTDLDEGVRAAGVVDVDRRDERCCTQDPSR